MKITASNTQIIQPKVSPIINNNVAEGVLKLDDKNVPSFSERLSSGIDQVANTQNEAAKLAKNFELGAENDLAKVMVGQQVSSLAFQLTLNVRNKALIQTPRGTMELKAFFSVGIQQSGESESASATSIKYKIKKLVDQEDPNSPVSDDLIVSTLAKDGVSVARRTVAKYRKMESIPSSFARKRRNVLSGVV